MLVDRCVNGLLLLLGGGGLLIGCCSFLVLGFETLCTELALLVGRLILLILVLRAIVRVLILIRILIIVFGLPPFHKASFLNLPSLTTLRLHSNRSTDKSKFISNMKGIGWSNLKNVKKLEKLELSGLRWDDLDCLEGLHHLTSLTSLALYGVKGVSSLHTLDAYMPNLRSLTVAACGMTAVAWFCLASSLLPRLEKFAYMGNVSRSDCAWYKTDPKPWVFCSDIHASALGAAVVATKPWRLRELTLDSMAVSSREEWMWLVESIFTPASVTLVSLSLNGVKFGDPDIAPMARWTLAKLRALRVLYAEDTDLKKKLVDCVGPIILPPRCRVVGTPGCENRRLAWVGDTMQRVPDWVDARCNV
jgi:hypothetical protein